VSAGAHCILYFKDKQQIITMQILVHPILRKIVGFGMNQSVESRNRGFAEDCSSFQILEGIKAKMRLAILYRHR